MQVDGSETIPFANFNKSSIQNSLTDIIPFHPVGGEVRRTLTISVTDRRNCRWRAMSVAQFGTPDTLPFAGGISFPTGAFKMDNDQARGDRETRRNEWTQNGCVARTSVHRADHRWETRYVDSILFDTHLVPLSAAPRPRITTTLGRRPT